MKTHALSSLFLTGLLLWGCGKPVPPESLKPDITDGGYKITARFQTQGFAQDVAVTGNFAYIAQGEGGLLIADINDKKNPVLKSVTTENVRGYSSKIAVKDSVVYLAAGTFGITVINVSDKSNPQVTASNLSVKPAKNLYVLDNYLFTSISEKGVKISEISYPVYPDIRGNISTSGYARSCIATSDTNYLLIATGEMGLSIVNISNFQNGFGNYPQVGFCNTPGYAEDIKIDNSRHLAYLACGTAGVQIVDFSDVQNPYVAGNFDTHGYAKELFYENNKIYVTCEKSGLKIIDVNNTSKPKLTGQIDTGYALGIDADQNYIYVADEKEGLIIIAKPG
jgi:hypothetical protein